MVHTLMPEQSLDYLAANIDEKRLKFTQFNDTWLVYDPIDQNWTHLMTFDVAITKILDHFNTALGEHMMYDGVILLCHDVEPIPYFLKALKKSGLYDSFLAMVKGFGTLDEYISGRIYFFININSIFIF